MTKPLTNPLNRSYALGYLIGTIAAIPVTLGLVYGFGYLLNWLIQTYNLEGINVFFIVPWYSWAILPIVSAGLGFTMKVFEYKRKVKGSSVINP